jgi:hypothetical protein
MAVDIDWADAINLVSIDAAGRPKLARRSHAGQGSDGECHGRSDMNARQHDDEHDDEAPVGRVLIRRD